MKHRICAAPVPPETMSSLSTLLRNTTLETPGVKEAVYAVLKDWRTDEVSKMATSPPGCIPPDPGSCTSIDASTSYPTLRYSSTSLISSSASAPAAFTAAQCRISTAASSFEETSEMRAGTLPEYSNLHKTMAQPSQLQPIQEEQVIWAGKWINPERAGKSDGNQDRYFS